MPAGTNTTGNFDIARSIIRMKPARLATQGMPAAGTQRLSDISDTARAALIEMRRVLGVLREDTQAETADGTRSRHYAS